MNIYFDEANNKEEDVFSGIDPNTLAPELQTIYKNMQADYTRKTQSIAEERTNFGTEREGFENKLKTLGAIEQEVTQWRDWYKGIEEASSNDDQTSTDLTSLEDDDLPDYLKDLGDGGTPSVEITALNKTITDLRSEIDTINKSLKDHSSQTNRMFDYQAQLTDLQSTHETLDKKALLSHAVENGFTDLDKAYNDLYRDDIIEEEVQKRVKLEVAKSRTAGIKTGGQQIIVRSGEGTPRSFAEASEKVLAERAAQGL